MLIEQTDALLQLGTSLLLQLSGQNTSINSNNSEGVVVINWFSSNRNIIIFLVIFIGLLLFIPSSIIFQQQLEKKSYEKAAHYDLSKESLYNLKLTERLTISEIDSNLLLLEDETNEGTFIVNDTDIISVIDELLYRIVILGNEVSTTKEISLASDYEDIVRAYGDDYYKREEQSFRIIGYPDKELNATLEFWILNEELHRIKFEIDEPI
ncbi:hypothetical protein [Bacillus sp. FJAT-45037]|uniref:hypothetical protein n=1 Tax=Bacillus sp. FJAT-45037 TaxID=2011007 RepID=UPI000C24A7D9|nr:hypothetical protein [Bacillus sp. FJAT-45037]